MTVYSLYALVDALRARRGEHLRKHHGLTNAQYELLREAHLADGELPLGALAEHIGCSRGNLTGIADRLEAEGWVVRERDAKDRRVVRIQIVPERRQQVAAIIAEVAALEEQWSRQLEPVAPALEQLATALVS